MSASQHGLMKPRSLGSKARSFVPMTPRSLKSNNDSHSESSRQAAAHNPRAHDGQPPHKKFKSSAAPKGTKLASGYVDRAQERQREQEGDGDEKHRRLTRLEEMLKLQQIDQETFDRLKVELGIGGDTSSTHLVKGLDFKLLERVRRGEEVNKGPAPAEKNVEPAEEVDVDDELEKALERTEVEARQVQRDEEAAEGANAQVPESEATILNRDEILRRLKLNRKNPNLASPDLSAAHPTSALDRSRFRKLESASKPNKKRFTETVNGRRREVLVVTDKEGKTKRKTRWLDPEPDGATRADAQEKGQSAQAWGGDIPEQLLARQKAAAAAAEAARNAAGEDEDDIFGGVAEYDPLAGLDSDGERETEESRAEGEQSAEAKTKRPVKARDYFASTSDANDSRHPAHDPSILAALKRAAQIRKQEDEDGKSHDRSKDQRGPPSENGERNAALLRKLQSQSRQDDMDVDMAFGGGGDDDDDDDGNGLSKQKLSQWVGLGQENDDEEEETQRSNGRKRKKRRQNEKEE